MPTLKTKEEEKAGFEQNLAVEQTVTNETEQITETEKPSAKKRIEYLPETDIYTDKDAVYLEANIPGVNKEDLEVSVEKNKLFISAKNSLSAPEGYELQYAEFRNGDYRRSFQINEDIDTDAIEASIKDGVLYLKLPFKQPIVKKIDIQIQ